MHEMMVVGKSGLEVGIYSHLMFDVLATQHNRNKLAQRIKEVYFENSQHGKVDVSIIVDTIDGENILIIEQVYSLNGYSEEYIDNVLTDYYNDVSFSLEMYVTEFLYQQGLYYKQYHETVEVFPRMHGQLAVFHFL